MKLRRLVFHYISHFVHFSASCNGSDEKVEFVSFFCAQKLSRLGRRASKQKHSSAHATFLTKAHKVECFENQKFDFPLSASTFLPTDAALFFLLLL
jgi:hypothetical protein